MRVENTRGLWWEHMEEAVSSKQCPITAALCKQRSCEQLPLEMWEAIFRVVSPTELCSLRAVCRGWQVRLDDPEVDNLWKCAYEAEWRSLARSLPLVQRANEWRSSFLLRWWAHSRWGVKAPTICTLMGKKAHGGTVTCVALGRCGVDSGEGEALSASDDGSIFLWRFAKASGANALADSPHVVAQQHHRQSSGGDVRCPQRTKRFYGHAGSVWCLCFDPENDRLLSGGYDGTVKSWSLSRELCEMTLRGHHNWVTALQSLQGGQRCVSGGSDGIIKFWDLGTRQCLQTRGPPDADPRHYTRGLTALEEKGILLSAHSEKQHLLQWDLESMRVFDCCRGHTDDIYALHSDSPASLLATGSKDRTVRVWDTRIPDGQCVGILRGHTGAVLDLKLRGNRAVSASMDKTIRMWDIRQSESPVTTLEGHSSEVHCVDFYDRMVFSGSRDTSIKAWTVV